MLGPRGGSLQAWSAAANSLFAAGCEAHSFALMCAFGAPLMRFHSESEGGAIVNLVSSVSATGKTTALEAIASVWGELDGLRLTDEDTKVSRGIFLGTLGNLPCVFDELHKRDPDTIREFCIAFTNGRDKLRGAREGTLRTTPGEWQTILVLGSNLSIVDIMQAENNEEAQAFRVLEFQAEQTFSGVDGDRLRRELRANAGWAGETYLKYIIQPDVLPIVRQAVEDTAQMIRTHAEWKFDARHRYWVRAISCAHVGGRIATELGLISVNPARITEWAILNCRDRKQREFHRDYVQVLNEALYELHAATLVVDREWRQGTACQVLAAPVRGFYARRERNNGKLYVSRKWMHTWLSDHRINRTSFVDALLKNGVLVNPAKFVTLGAGTEQSGGGQIQCFEIDLHHGAMMEQLMVSERDVDDTAKRDKPLSTIVQFQRRHRGAAQPPAAASPSPPASSE